MNRICLYIATLVACLFLFGCSTTEVEERGVPYKVKIHDASDRGVRKAIREISLLYTMNDRLPSTVGQLRRRMERDVPRIEAVLEARGYYDGQVRMELDQECEPVQVNIQIDLGEPYRFRAVELRFLGPPDEELESIKSLVRRRNRVVADTVFIEQQRILDLMNRKGYPFAELSRRSVLVDREHQVVDLVLEFDPDGLAYFGPVLVEGMEKVPEKFVHRQVPWREGRRYDSQLVRDFETKLLSSGLFGSARITPEEPAAETNMIPIRVSVSERAQRSIRLGVNYSDIGPGGRIFWEHRSFFGEGERLEASLLFNPIEIEGGVKLTRPGFLDANQALVLDLRGSIENPESYDSKKVRVGGMVLRDFTPRLQGGLGLAYQYSLVEQFGQADQFAHVLFPLQLILDKRNDRLNPVAGYQAFGRTTWYEDTVGQESFLKTFVEGRDYHMLWERYRLSSGLRLTLGSIDGTRVENVPADERFYAGGGGSIRGYEYQMVGPMLNGTPTGGDKLLEMSAELRMQPGNHLGYVAFVDAGAVYNDLIDDHNRTLRFGAGLGLRWFTTIGPLRADLAYPLNPDESQVERVQFYISLGQAF